MGSKTIVDNSTPPPTEAELELQRTNTEIAKQQLAAIQKQTEFQQKQFDLSAPIFEQLAKSNALTADLLPQQIELQKQELERSLKLGPIQDELLQKQLDEIRRGGAASPEQLALIKRATDASIASGESDISRFQQQGLQQIRNELAPSRGLRPTDTPIQDVGFRLGEESQRQQGQLVRDLRGAEATAALNYPLAQGQFVASTAGFQQNLAAAARDFQAQLQQQAADNRYRLLSGTGAGGLGLTGAGGNPFNALSTYAADRASRGTTSQRSSGFGLGEIGSLAGGVGGLVSAFSSKSLKHCKRAIKKAQMLEKLKNLNVERWQYLWDKEEHIGPYAEDFKREFGLGDGKSISLMDMMGILVASVQALDDRVTHAGV